MPASSNLLGNIGTVITNGPAAASLALAAAAAGPILDYVGMTNSVKLHLQEAQKRVNVVKAVTDSGDSANLALLNKVLAALNGTSTPSTTLITDLNSVAATGPGAASIVLANAAAGPLTDYVGNLQGAILTLKEAFTQIALLISVTDNGTDGTNRTLLANLNLALV